MNNLSLLKEENLLKPTHRGDKAISLEGFVTDAERETDVKKVRDSLKYIDGILDTPAAPIAQKSLSNIVPWDR
jgi:hypothetical protein